MEKVVITGGSGLIGTPLTQLLLKNGYEVVHLSRRKSNNTMVPTFLWDYTKNYIEEGALENASHIIHLAGESIAGGRWTAERKKSILESRTKTAEFIFHKVKEKNISLKSFISASGSSYYGTVTSANIFKEEDSQGSDFAAQVVIEWEKSVDKFKDACRVVKLRTGIVLDLRGGALKKMYGPIKWGIGSALGSGKQYLPWIHIEDMCELYLFGLKNNISGNYNAVSTEHVTNGEFIKAIGKASNHWVWMPKVPKFILRLLFGEMSIVVLEGSRISNEKIKKEGFQFKFPELKNALKDIFDKEKKN
jgi:uncharacterized protein (TIGR01777 family)